MRNVLGFIALLIVALDPIARADHGIESVSNELMARDKLITSIYVKYRHLTLHHAEKVPPITVLGEYAEDRNGRYFLDLRWIDEQGRETRRRVMSFDGKDYWLQTYPVRGDEAPPPIVTRGEDNRQSYEIEAFAKRYVGLSLLAPVSELPTGYLGFAERLARASRAEILTRGDAGRVDKCCTLQASFDSDEEPSRVTLELDQSRGYVLLGLRRERLIDGSWVAMEVATDVKIGETSFTSGGEGFKFWYPERLSVEMMSRRRTKLITHEIAILDVALDAPIQRTVLTPQIEDGTAIIDIQKGRSFVHGGGPSKRLKQQLAKRVEESRKELNTWSEFQPPPGKQPTSIGTYISIAAVALGILGLVGALAIRIAMAAR